MKNIRIPDNIIYKIANGARKSTLYSYVTNTVMRHFRSVHNMSSLLISDCVLLNLVLNKEITPSSADEIITSIRRNCKSLYTTVDSAYFPIEDRFIEYAQHVLGDDYENHKDMRTTNFIVYVISLDIKNSYNINTNEALMLSLDYNELSNYSFLLEQ